MMICWAPLKRFVPIKMTKLPLLVLRSLAFYVGYVTSTVVMSLLFILLFPLLGKKGRYLLASTWCNTVLSWLRICCGVRYRIIGAERIPESPAVILSNHQSSWETILFYILVYPVSPILKKELLNIPFWGWALRLQQPIAIDRSKPREAGKSLLTQGIERIKQGNSVIVFPEGTRRDVGAIRRFSRGGAKLAIAAGVPIIPVAHNAGHCWPPRQFVKRPGLVSVIIGEPIPLSEHSADSLTKQTEQWIREQVDRLESALDNSGA